MPQDLDKHNLNNIKESEKFILDHSLTLLKLFLNEYDGLVIILDEHAKTIFLNSKAQQIIDNDKKSFLKINLPHLLSAQTESFETTLNLDQEERKVIQWKIIRFNIEHQSYSLLLGKDITDFDKLKNKFHTLDYIVKKVPGYVFWKDKNLRNAGCNENFAKQVGFEYAEDVIGKSDYELPWDPAQTEHFLRDDQEIMATGIPKLNFEERQTQLTGEEAILLTSKVPLRDHKGEITGILGMYLDITELKKSQANLQKAKGQIDGMTLISASIAHELRTPLAAIKSMVYGMDAYLPDLVKSYRLAKESRLPVSNISEQHLKNLSEAIGNINKKVDHSNMIIDMLLANLAYDQIDTSDFTQCSIKDCAWQSAEKYVFTEDQKELIHINIEKDFVFVGKAILIIHVLFNLFKNSLYFIQKTGKGNIYIWTEFNDKINRLHFKDTGQGIKKSELPYIFDQFYSKGIHHGTGIGLAFSKMVMKAHQGDISCRSIYGEYAEFILTFPVVSGDINLKKRDNCE